jgi:hypothetical protein
MNTQTDPLQSITVALQNLFVPKGLVSVNYGWPDANFLTVDSNFPTLFVYSNSDTAKYMASSERVHAVINNSDGLSATVYKEKLRKIYMLQLSLFTKTQDDLQNYGWMIEQQLVTYPLLQIGIPNVETALFKYKSQNNPLAETGYYQRDMIFETTARVLDASTAYLAKQMNLNSDTNG